jgi:exosortase/archaeosortase family protein
MRIGVERNAGIEHVRSLASRNELFAGLVVLAYVNGFSERVIVSVTRDGMLAALLQTFDISVLVWSACAISIAFLLRGPPQPIEQFDMLLTAVAVAAFVMPIAPLSWVVLSAVAIYVVRRSPSASFLHRGAWIVLAITVPMFWGRLLFAMLSDVVLQGDAVLIASVLGTQRVGNAVQYADGSGYLWIAPACSSLTNISLAILCWVMFTRVADHKNSLLDVAWGLAACGGVVAINVARISLIGLYPDHFDLIHGVLGATIASWLIVGVTVGICRLGVRHDHPRGAWHRFQSRSDSELVP